MTLNHDLEKELIELKQDKKVFYEYIKAFYEIEKVQDTYEEDEEFKRIKDYIKNEDD